MSVVMCRVCMEIIRVAHDGKVGTLIATCASCQSQMREQK